MSAFEGIQDGVVETMSDAAEMDVDEFVDLNDEEKDLQRSLMEACRMAENANKRSENENDIEMKYDDVGSRNDKKRESVGVLMAIDDDEKPGCSIELSSETMTNDEFDTQNEVSVKMEFACSPESILEPNMDYPLDDVNEVLVTSEDDPEDDISTVLYERPSRNDVETKDCCVTGPNKSMADVDHNEELLTVFNDHNYMTQENNATASDVSQDLRKSIIDHIVKKRTIVEGNNFGAKNCDDEDNSNTSVCGEDEENSKREIENFVDQILEGKIEPFVGKDQGKKRTDKDIHTEDFVQNIFDVFAEEDEAEYAAEEILSNKQTKLKNETQNESSNSILTEISITQTGLNTSNANAGTDNDECDRTETCSFQTGSEHDSKIVPEDIKDTEKNNESFCLSATDDNADSSLSDQEVGDQVESIGTLPECCSEPLEITSLEERFGQLATTIEEPAENIPATSEEPKNDATTETEGPTADENKQDNIQDPEITADNSKILENDVAHNVEITTTETEAQETVQLEPQTITENNENDSCDKELTEKNKEDIAAKDDESNHDRPTEEMETETSLASECNPIEQVMKDVENSYSSSPLLKEFSALAREMNEDCEKFALATTNIDTRLSAYIIEKYKIIRALVQRCTGVQSCFADSAAQTDPVLSKRRLKKLNKKDKKALLESTDSSSCSSDDNMNSSSDEDERKRRNNERKLVQEGHDPSSMNNTESVTIAQKIKDANDSIVGTAVSSQPSQVSSTDSETVYYDGVCLLKYLRSEMFMSSSNKRHGDRTSGTSTPTKGNSSPSHSMPPTDDEANQEPSTSEAVNKINQKQKQNKREAMDENDKEIERLINLDGLMKRHNNNPSVSSKLSDVEKHKPKLQNQKNKTDNILEFLESELPKDSLSSEESANENEGAQLTEQQFLDRCNQNLKKLMLFDSASEVSHDGEVEDEFAGPELSEESECGHRSPLVDKFLKTYNLEESEEEEEDVEMTPCDSKAKDISSSTVPKIGENNNNENGSTLPSDIIKHEDNQENNNTGKSTDNSDCELLGDNFIYRKRSQPKSLEKILNEAEKRKKLQKIDEDAISLSSESSECSDVEAIEPTESAKSRAIKPMLRPDQLQRETVKAQKQEAERIRRLEKRQAMLKRVLSENKDLQKDEELVLDYCEETKTFVKVHPELVKQLKPHQREGVRFMYDSCYGGIDASKKNHGSGCILAHCMGLGKTLQLITLMHTVISYKELKTHKILVLCPKSTVMNWSDEISRWLYPLRSKNLKVYTFNDVSDINDKLSVMRDWSQSTYQKAGCLLIGYEAFRTLVFYHTYKMRSNLDSTKLEKIRNLIDEYLLQPGADLVVCDEGHIIKNSKSAISSAVAEIKTLKRIVLTGTPIQNNLKEYYSMVNFIKPLFLGTEKEFANLYANPIKNGQHKDSNKRDIKVMKQRSFVLHKKLSKFVQRKEAELLKSFLPKKFEYVLFIPMTNVQNKLYERILETITSRQDNRGRSLITDYTCLRKIWTHPKVLEDAWKNAINHQFKRDAKKQPNSEDDQPDDIYDSQTGFMSVKNDWWRNLIAEKDLESILPSNKLRTMFEILRMCEENGDKCLIFSAFVAVLNVVEYFFKKLAAGDKDIINELNLPPGTRSTWESNKDYFRLDGKTSKTTRHEMIKRFNLPNNTRARVFLISAKAGGQGINLIGANRVIILDTSWNPSNDQQNIFRIFRLGQKKNCYIYRLLAMGTMEEKVYSRSVTKQAMSFRVMDVQQIDRHYSMAELAELYTLTTPNYGDRPTPVFPQDPILASLLRSYPDLVYKYHEHDSLLENKVEQELSEQEKIDAWAAYENDLQMNSQMANADDIQNRLAQGNMPPNYMATPAGGIPGLNLQALLNFRGANASPNPSYMSPSLLQQYKYSMANQQFLDMFNSYRQFSTPETAAAFNASVAAAYSSITTGIYPGPVPSSSPHNASSANLSASLAAAAASHPLNALSDLSMYGIGTNPVATSLAQLSSATNVNSLYSAPSMQQPTPPPSVPSMYSNQTAYLQALQQLGYAAPGANALLNNPALNSFTNSSSFQAPRRTPPQTGSRKSSTPDLTGYRSSANVSVPALTPPAPSNVPLPTMPMTSMGSKPNEFSGTSNSSLNSNTNNNASTSATNKNTIDSNSNRVGSNKSASLSTTHPTSTATSMSTSSHSALDSGHTKSAGRFDLSSEALQNIYMAQAKSQSSMTTTATQPTTTISPSTSKGMPPRLSEKPANSNIAPSKPKKPDPQIRVKDMGQLVGNNNRSSSLQAAAMAAARDVASTNFINTITNTNTKSNSNSSNTSTSTNRKRPSTLASTSTATASDLMKARSEMQIIPTTSPPGTASISKQLSEISPSISLTAVRNTSSSSNNAKQSTANSANVTKVSTANASTTAVAKNGRVNSPLTLSSSNISNRQTSTSSNAQQTKVGNTLPTVRSPVNTKKSSSPTIGPTGNLLARKNVMPMQSQSMPAISSSSLTTNSNAGTSKAISSSGNGGKFGSANITKQNLAPTSTVRTSTTAITTPSKPSTTASTTATSTKNVQAILKNSQRQAPPVSIKPSMPTLTAAPVSINASTNSNNQPKLSINAKSTTFDSNARSNVTTTGTATAAANAAQLLYNNKSHTTLRRSFTPTVTFRTSPVRSVGKILPTSNIRQNQIAISTLPSSATTSGVSGSVAASAATSAFPVQLQRNNSVLGTIRTLSPLSAVRTAPVSGLGNRAKSSTAIMTPKIASVTSLNTTAVASNAVVANASTPAATAARVATFKKFINSTGKASTPNARQLQTISALKVAAASSVSQAQQSKRTLSPAVVAQVQQQQQQKQPQEPQSKQRISIQANGRAVNVTASRISPGDAKALAGGGAGSSAGGISIRPVVVKKSGATNSSISTSPQPNGDKRSAVSSPVSSSSGQAMMKLISERKRKSSDIVYKEGAGLSKRPKDS